MQGMSSPLAVTAAVDDWKLLFRVLHAQLPSHLELMDSDALTALQGLLQARARAEGVDVTDHAAWDAWLGVEGAPGCDTRNAQRRILA